MSLHLPVLSMPEDVLRAWQCCSAWSIITSAIFSGAISILLMLAEAVSRSASEATRTNAAWMVSILCLMLGTKEKFIQILFSVSAVILSWAVMSADLLTDVQGMAFIPFLTRKKEHSQMSRCLLATCRFEFQPLNTDINKLLSFIFLERVQVVTIVSKASMAHFGW